MEEWLHLVLRWFHVVAGITWIGQTYLFNAMENWMHESESGQLWMVHGGGFYLVEKQKVPQMMPRQLRWFKWESGLTWISGFFLLLLTYYWEGLLFDAESKYSSSTLMVLGLLMLVLGFLIYDSVWKLPFVKKESVGVLICFLFLVGSIYVSTQLFSSRGAYMQVGAMIGTVMAANVWLRIIPGQKELVQAISAGKSPDMVLSLRGKRCSKHNTYMSVPLIFIMVSNHFPTLTYGATQSWLVLSLILLVGFAAARVIRGSF